jgi:hypothetical protein
MAVPNREGQRGPKGAPSCDEVCQIVALWVKELYPSVNRRDRIELEQAGQLALESRRKVECEFSSNPEEDDGPYLDPGSHKALRKALAQSWREIALPSFKPPPDLAIASALKSHHIRLRGSARTCDGGRRHRPGVRRPSRTRARSPGGDDPDGGRGDPDHDVTLARIGAVV